MTEWRRLSPWGILFFLLGQLRQWAQAIPAALAGGVYMGKFDISTALLVLILVAPFAMGLGALVSWWRFLYQLKPGRLEITQGWFFRKHLEIPAERVQNIEVSQPLYFKPLGLFNLHIETAGASGQEAKLAALREDEVKAVKAMLLAAQSEVDTEAPEAEPPLLTRSIGDLLLFGLCHNHLAWLLVVMAPFYDNLADQLDWLLDGNLDTWGPYAYLVGFIVLVLVLTVLSMLAAVLIYHPYRLERQQGKLLQSGGLLNHRQLAMEHRRLQWLELRRNLLDRLFGRWQLSLHPVRDGNTKQGQEPSQKLLAPALRTAELPELLALAGAQRLPQGAFGRPPAYYLGRLLLWTALPALLLGAGSAIELGWGALLLGLAPWCWVYLYWLGCGWQLDEDRLWVRRGLWSQHFWLLLPHKVQGVKLVQSPGQRTRGYATLALTTAAGHLTLPYLPLRQACYLRDWLLAKAQQRPEHWL